MERMKDLECVHCDKFFECDGKPEGTYRCIQYEERKDLKKNDEPRITFKLR